MRSLGSAVLVLGLCSAGMGVEQDPEVRQAPGSPTSVSPKPTPPLPEGSTGLAAKYPGDEGLESDPDVVFTESFGGTVEEICSRWDQAAGQPIMSTSDDVPPGSRRKQSLLLTRVAGGTSGYQDGGNLYRRLKNEKGGYGYDQLFFRFYMKFNQDHAPIHHYGAGLIGYNPPSRWPLGGAGLRPKGEESFLTQVEPGDFTSWNSYTYWQEMGGSPPSGQTWGNSFEAEVPARPVERDRWICLELMVKLNDLGDSNGEQAYWLDGKLSRKGETVTSYQGKGFPAAGTWYFDRFAPGVSKEGIAWDYDKKKPEAAPGGRPFPGFAWRKSRDLTINAVWLYRYMSRPEKATSKVWWSNLVVARKYIGPLSP